MSNEYALEDISGKKCRERYHNHLNPTLRKEEWTVQEEQKLLRLHHSYGNSWAVISREFQGRTDNAVKNKFFSKMRKALKVINLLNLNQHHRRFKDIKIVFIHKLIEIIQENTNQNTSLSKQIIEEAKNLKNKILAFQHYSNEEANTSLQDLMQKISMIRKYFLKTKKHKKSKRKVKNYSDSESVHYEIHSQDQQFQEQQINEVEEYDCSMNQRQQLLFNFEQSIKEDYDYDDKLPSIPTCHCNSCMNHSYCQSNFNSHPNNVNREQGCLEKPFYPYGTISHEETILNPFTKE